MDTNEASPDSLARLFKALSSGTRISLLRLLKGRSLCVGALAARLGVSQSAVSQHLQVLSSAGLVEAERRGYYTHYRVSEEGLEACARALDELARGE